MIGEEDETRAIEAVRELVRSGFYEPDEIIEYINEAVFEPGEIDPEWLRAQIEEERRKKKAEEADWPSVTDCDRLDRAFATLERHGILALQNAGYTQSDGLADIAQFYHEAGGERSGIIGYCFFHGQDLERVMKTGELNLAYGYVEGTEENGIEIGQGIKRVLVEAGFAVVWDGSVGQRLLVQGINWQRRQT